MSKEKSNPPPPLPLTIDERASKIQPREPLVSLEDVEFEYPITVNAPAPPDAKVSIERLESDAYEVRLTLSGVSIGEHAFPANSEAREFKPEKDIRTRQREWPSSKGHLPDHLALRPFPRGVPEQMRVPRRIDSDPSPGRERDALQATTIFSPDNRTVFYDTAFPWCTTGRIDTPGGPASGVMVGPRHVLTCSHAIQWNLDGTTGWLKFTPSYYNESTPFGSAWGIQTYWEGVKVYGPTIEGDEEGHDYVCVVLDSPIGNLTGWMGARSWSDDWDDEPFWTHVGYPWDLTGSERPSYQDGIALDGSFWDAEEHTRIFHKGDVWPGQSGGPFFAWWAGESWPSVVGDQSGENSDENQASGGAHMVDCINRARADFP
jgi:V8-like Glu-specific endopeptidase